MSVLVNRFHHTVEYQDILPVRRRIDITGDAARTVGSGGGKAVENAVDDLTADDIAGDAPGTAGETPDGRGGIHPAAADRSPGKISHDTAGIFPFCRDVRPGKTDIADEGAAADIGEQARIVARNRHGKVPDGLPRPIILPHKRLCRTSDGRKGDAVHLDIRNLEKVNVAAHAARSHPPGQGIQLGRVGHPVGIRLRTAS